MRFVRLERRPAPANVARALRTRSRWARIAALEARPELKYGGVFEQGASYQEGVLVTRSGSWWLRDITTRR
jgi:hypothetical protein